MPAMDATPIERVASPAELADLLAALPLEKALPYALAGYGENGASCPDRAALLAGG